MPFRQLNLPRYAFDIRETDGQKTILDPVRRRQYVLTPEEWVRQHVVQFLLHERGYPAGLVSLEHSFMNEGRQRRADIVVYGKDARPLLLVECKAATVLIGQSVFDQVARYNQVVDAQLIVVTNGLVHYCYKVVSQEDGNVEYEFLEDLPSYSHFSA